ncbi:DUF2800 domain-containing protein [Megasphaera elsdenii]|uniref:DUF2800 domain-containing protein n=1 Tax=Megasphaera elsdenii TaxID=907 RepID=UPI001D018A91|nr:DUF2800 domain-containing protein [Megasphaera elsdenii]MCB5701469.1 DUF2800 domain-containing protein [Megasphaera elsdenii]MCB5726229.1 DUF2800 domain-containing protein [Megasphaera elsdenii]MCB5770048.1 DUF2800 domain-containing protein [Megasphaera elsdenii]
MPGTHAILSASSSSRWLACPPSAQINAELPETTSVYAEEGTKAHALAEKTLKGYLAGGPAEVQSDNEEMKEAVQRYVDVCIEKINAAKKASPDAVVHVEFRLDFSTYVPDGFGTGDMVIVSDNSLEICDLKYGKGVPVSAEGNTQMRLYALGAVEEFGMLYAFDTVHTTIIQPRLDSVSTDTLSAGKLLDWGRSIIPVAKLAYDGKGEFQAGDHCRFCKFRPRCKALAAYMTEKTALRKKQTLTDLETVSILQAAKDIKRWLTDLEDYALGKALDGYDWPGMKLVEGRSKRVITDPDAAAAALIEKGFDTDAVYKPRELQTLTALEKLVGKKSLAEALGDIIEKPDGKPTLVELSDKRPPLDVTAKAADAFDDSLL